MTGFSESLHAVTLFMKKLHMGLEEAIKTAEVPPAIAEEIRKVLSGPTVVIENPGIIEESAEKRQLHLCKDLGETPQPHITSLRRFLLDVRERKTWVVDAIMNNTLEIVTRLPDPGKNPSFKSRGLIVGHIQSGKTANMAGLIARAADQGYRLFIVLAGIVDDLRSQTQRRLDQEITGDSEDRDHDGPFVAHEPGALNWSRLTNSGLGGEFRLGTHAGLNPATLKLAVIKKHPSVIRKFIRFLELAQVPLGDQPALIIDDEADQASTNTNYGITDDDGEELDPTRTNQRIRDLLAKLPKCVYVGFTATPFANVLIDRTEEEDLYPRDFILTLPEPSGYQGPRNLFGLGMTPSDISPEAPERPALDVIRHVPHDQADSIANAGTIPPILTEAMLSFILSCCGRLARGQNRDHFTMLIHPSGRIEQQNACHERVCEEFIRIKEAIGRPKFLPAIEKMAKELWEKDFMRVSATDPEAQGRIDDFETVWKFAPSLVESIEIMVLNSSPFSRNAYRLEYNSPTPKRYIVIGGNRLSRGLTLEGLSVSVFTRFPPQYDTLLQMGRWFGYRPEYKDLTRIYVEDNLADLFADLARIELELRNDLAKYAEARDPRVTPMDIMPKIRMHPAMAITAANKTGAGERQFFSFQGNSSQTVSFPVRNKQALTNNLNLGVAWVKRLGKPSSSEDKDGMHIWKDVPAGLVLELIKGYEFGERAGWVNRRELTNYISRQNQVNELVSWDIVIPRGNPKLEPIAWNTGILSRKVYRSKINNYSIGVLSSPNDLKKWKETAGRTEEDPMKGGLLLYVIDKESGVEEKNPFFDKPTLAEDILGFVFEFPHSQSTVNIEYFGQREGDD